MKKRICLAAAFAAVLILVFAGCSGTQTPTASPSASASASASASTSASATGISINAAGPDYIAALITDLGKTYMAGHPGILVNAEAQHSNIAIAKCADGTADIGLSSRALKDIEKATFTNMKEQVLCLDGLAVVVEKSSPITGLTSDQVKSIFTGKTLNWSDVGGASGAIKLYTMESTTEIRKVFNSLFLGTDEKGNTIDTEDTKSTTFKTSAEMATALLKDPSAIGYMPLNSISGDELKKLDIGGVAATSDNVLGGSYQYYLKFILLTRGAKPEAAAFVDYCMGGEAAEYMKENGYTIPAQR